MVKKDKAVEEKTLVDRVEEHMMAAGDEIQDKKERLRGVRKGGTHED